MLVIAVGTAYSGALFGKLSQLLPGSASFEDMARAALGKHGRWLVYCTVRRTTSAVRSGQRVSSTEQPLLPLQRLAVQAEQWLSAMSHITHLLPLEATDTYNISCPWRPLTHTTSPALEAIAPHTSTAQQDSCPPCPCLCLCLVPDLQSPLPAVLCCTATDLHHALHALKGVCTRQLSPTTVRLTRMSCSPQVYVAIFLDPVIFHLTSAKSLQQIFWWKPMPLWVAGVIVAAIMVPLGQVSAGQVDERVCLPGAQGMRAAP